MSQEPATIEQWHKELATLHSGHFMAAALFQQRHWFVGVPTVVLSAIAGTAVFATLQSSPDIWVKVLIGMLSIAAAILASLQTFLGYLERSQQHKTAGLKYGALRREVEEALALRSDTEPVPPELFNSIRTRWEVIEQESPPLPQKIHDRAYTHTRESKSRSS